ncbi:MAG: hypothetical protein KF762_13075 [Acidobacteria bacterium]|nr:hypothetical protein [Acidobacteriota bacterium]
MNEIRDFNGQGRWSREEIERRFRSYAKAFGTTGLELNPRIYEAGSTKWFYPLIEEVIVGIRQGDRACIELGVELIEDSDSMPFGKILKSDAAKALRHSAGHLSEDHRRRIRKRVADMLIEQYMPREFVQYVKLARTVGFAEELERVRSEADLTNRWVRHYLERLTGIDASKG